MENYYFDVKTQFQLAKPHHKITFMTHSQFEWKIVTLMSEHNSTWQNLTIFSWNLFHIIHQPKG